MKEYIKINKKRWEELATIHFKSEFYNVEKFKEGGISISDLEINEVGDVKGKKLLHLQCHFGKDTLSWARLGAHVTGVDFSSRAIELARQLSAEIGIEATFIQSDIYDLDRTSLKQNCFDIVFTSNGAIYWLPDLKKWAQFISHFLKLGGFFYILDSHPTGNIFDDECENDLIVRYPYFHQEKPLEFDEEGSYADERTKLTNTKEYGWAHDMGSIVNSLIEAGLRIDFVHEYPFVAWKMLPFLEQKGDGWWHLPERFQQVPLTFSLKATKNSV
ncbi:MAG: class I SAM-dependent methyltransferase [Candidatus Heimdallarchaeota archaeon]|nr:MAG: class I SAM-dependent methyltransferase [Candidatus Heimdallarchaeota archaeon]